MKFTTVTHADSSRKSSEDRVGVREIGNRTLIAIADGAGGHGGGGSAADFALCFILGWEKLEDPASWVMCLAEVDRLLSKDGSGGETTAVAALVSPDSIVGASVGDSGAWLVGSNGFENLTSRQQRKPLLGSGVSIPVMFQHHGGAGTLLLATDGLLKYTSAEKIGDVLRRQAPEAASKSLVELVRLRSGELQDDVALAICRR